jgi:hypothetical protein
MATKKPYALMSTADFGKLCDVVMKAQRKTDEDIQKLAVAAIGYSHIHGDTGPANRLLGAMQKSLRVDSLVRYIEKFGKLAYMSKEKKFEYFKDAPVAEFDAELCNRMKWYAAKAPNQPESIYDFVAEFDKFMEKMQKKIDSGKPVEHAELFDKLMDVSAQYHGEKQVAAAEGNE